MNSAKTDNNSELWNRFLNGDESSFAAFYRQNYKKLYSYAVNLGLAEEEAHDVIQELFVKLYTHPQLIKDTETILSFLFVSVRNAFINQIKKRKRTVYINELENFEFSYTVECKEIEDKEDVLAIKERVDEVMKLLTPRQKEIIYFRFLYQMQYEEIAEIMGLSVQSARNLIHRAIEKVRRQNMPDLQRCMFLLLLIFLVEK